MRSRGEQCGAHNHQQQQQLMTSPSMHIKGTSRRITVAAEAFTRAAAAIIRERAPRPDWVIMITAGNILARSSTRIPLVARDVLLTLLYPSRRGKWNAHVLWSAPGGPELANTYVVYAFHTIPNVTCEVRNASEPVCTSRLVGQPCSVNADGEVKVIRSSGEATPTLQG
ncbi:hypothetical protein MRX96_041174 [Rhipicephalus microplus]